MSLAGAELPGPRERARELITFCDGLETGRALHAYCARARMVARDVLDLAEAVEAERSARAAMQAERDRWRTIALRYSAAAADDEPGPA